MSVRQGELMGAGPADVISARQVELFLRQSILDGQNWFLALLEATARWTVPEERLDDRTYRYVVAGEAFDWMLLAERLCGSVDDLIPQQELVNLLFYGRPPVGVTQTQVLSTLGMAKHSMYLNFWYGVIVEESLQLAVREETEKQFAGRTLPDRLLQDATFQEIYGRGWTALFAEFRADRALPGAMATSPTEQREFTYWLFKYRLRHGERARVASDTRKGMRRLADLQHCSLHPLAGPYADSLPASLQSLLVS